jgi:signal transduction histidine kinase
MSLIRKLVLAQGPLALALVLVGLISRGVASRMGQASTRILADNYRSVLASEEMKGALREMDHELVAALWEERPLVPAAKATSHRRAFEAALAIQVGNITEPGEEAATRRLKEAWRQAETAIVADEIVPAGPERRKRYFAFTAPALASVDGAIDTIISINQDAMVRKSEHVRRDVTRAEDVVLWTVVLVALTGLAASLALTRRVLRPLNVVTAAVRRFGQGDLAARAQVAGTDELAVLAKEFNTMAGHLLRYRQSSLGELLLAERATQATLDALPDAVVVLDNKGAARRLNAAGTEVLGLDLERNPAVGLADVAVPLRGVVERVNTFILQGRGAYVPKGFEEAIHVSDGKAERIFLPRGAPIYGEAGDVSGAAIILQDVTRLFRFDELKSDLVATVAHELRTPLTSLRMALHLCLEETVGPLTPKQGDLLYAAREDCERLQGIVDDLLNLSRLEAGRMALRKRRLEPLSFLSLVADAHRAAAEREDIELLVDVRSGCPEAFADPDRLQLVFANLVGNAFRYTPRGARVILSATAAAPDREKPGLPAVIFGVKDEGPGIALEHQAHLFEKFYRVPGAPEGGAGLGLFIVRGIAEAHGGTCGVTSVPGHGAFFWFTVPGVQAKPVRDDAAATDGLSQQATPAIEMAAPGEEMRRTMPGWLR